VPFETVGVKPINIKFEFSSRTVRKNKMAEIKNSAITLILQANGLEIIVKEHCLQKSNMADKLKMA
jgi:hypothetical protein